MSSSWLRYLEGISNRELVDFHNKITENEILYPQNFKRAVSRILDIHEQFYIQEENYVDDITDLPDAEWYRRKKTGWSKNGLYEIADLTDKEWFLEMINNLIMSIDE